MKNRLFKGVIWSAVERFSVQGAQFILNVVIARMVLPSDYGLIAIVSVFLSVAQAFVDGGFTNALIQKQGRTEKDYSTVFFFNIIVGIGLFLILLILAPFIAVFYKEARLELLIQVVAIGLIIESCSTVLRAKLIIDLNFKLQAIISLVAVIISGTLGIGLAYYGFGVWALVWQTLINNVVATISLWFVMRWKPLLCFSKESFRQLFRHGSSLLVTAVINQVCLNLYYLVLGRYYTSKSAGYFNRAGLFAQFPANNVSNTINRALFPTLCEAQNDPALLLTLYKRYIRFSAFLLFPIVTILGSLADQFILIVLGEQWIEASGILRILCLAYFLTPVINLITQMLYAKKSAYSLWAELIKRPLSIVILLVTMSGGVHLVCWGLVIFSVFDFLITFFFLKKVINIQLVEHIRLLMPIIAMCILIVVNNIIITNIFTESAVQLSIGLVVSAVTVVGVTWIFKFEEYQLIKRMVRLTGK